MKKKKNTIEETGLKRPSVAFSVDEHKKVAHYCIENDITIGEFLRKSALYCARKDISFHE